MHDKVDEKTMGTPTFLICLGLRYFLGHQTCSAKTRMALADWNELISLRNRQRKVNFSPKIAQQVSDRTIVEPRAPGN